MERRGDGTNRGKELRELRFSEAEVEFVAPHIGLLSEHITDGGITNMAWQEQAWDGLYQGATMHAVDRVLWLVRGDGTLVSFTYNSHELVLAWARQEKALFADFHAASERFGRPLEALGFHRLDPLREAPLVPHRFQPLQFGHIPFTSAYHLASERCARVPALLGCPDFHVSRADGDQDRPN